MYRVVKIEKIKRETPTVKTFFFRDDSFPEPGQFYMIWLPGVDEFPMSISYIGGIKGFTVKKVGAGTAKMHSLEEGDRLWIRGPYGQGFSPMKGRILFVGGGSGMATLAPMIERTPGDIIIAARNREELLFLDRFRERRIYIATDNGSMGFRGFAHQLLEKILKEMRYDSIYTCGPELMLREIVDIALSRDMEIQASLERLMKCGIGI